MPHILANIPPVACYVRKEYLRDLQDGHGEFTPCYWVTVKAPRHRALYVEAFLPEYGALYDKLPISAFVQSPKTPENDLELGLLQMWDVNSSGIAVIEKTLLKNMPCKYRDQYGAWHKGTYMFTVDMVQPEPNELDADWAALPAEHKSFNFLRLDNGQFAAQPNNRIIWMDESTVSRNPKIPDFKVSTQLYTAEGDRWGGLGDIDSWSYEQKIEPTGIAQSVKKK